MWVQSLSIQNFRGIKNARVEFKERQTILVGPNGVGKSTILEAYALLFGKDRLVRTLTEHDFWGSDPRAEDRIRLIATITGFGSNDVSEHSQWFSERCGVPKWLTPAGALLPEQQSNDDVLAIQIGFSARFDRNELYVETIRYFHDDDSIVDPFDEDVIQKAPGRLLSEIGFFLIPAHRTWDRLVSFNSELFRKILESSGTLESAEVLAERDRLRQDEHRVDINGVLKALREGIDAELTRIMPGGPALELRLTATDTDSLLQALIPHYRYKGSISLPAGRHGSGLLSLQTALLILQIAERRRAKDQNVIIAVEEPELHMPPGVQAQILHRLQHSSNQLICTTHSPRVASVCSATDIRIVNAAVTASNTVVPMLKAPLPTESKNGVRKLFNENRQAFIEALMHRFVLVPEGKTDAEWLKLFSKCSASDLCIPDANQSKDSADPLFATIFGVAPTHEACVVDTVEKIKDMRDKVVVLVDGDADGQNYINLLIKAPRPPEHIFQWPQGYAIEDVVGWILGDDSELIKVIERDYPAVPKSIPEVVAWIKKPTSEKGAKTDFLAHDAIGSAILSHESAKKRAEMLLNAFVSATISDKPTTLVKADAVTSTANTRIWRLVL